MNLQQARQALSKAQAKDLTVPVVYQPDAHRWPEYGVISSVNDRYVHVRFDGDPGAKACYPESIEFDPVPRCACGARCLWVVEIWRCTGCRSEWTEEHGGQFAWPG